MMGYAWFAAAAVFLISFSMARDAADPLTAQLGMGATAGSLLTLLVIGSIFALRSF
jgi:hypothetical protein